MSANARPRNTMPETRPAARSSADDIGSTGEGASCGPGGCSCFVAGTLIAVAALTGVLNPGVALADGTTYATEADTHGVAIETLDVGTRVSTAQGESETQVDGTWEVYDLELTDGAGRPVMVTLLRPAGWLQERDSDGDGTFWLEVPGMGLRGQARVVSARGPPRLSEGPGRVVLGTFVRSAENVVTLGLAGFGEALATTANHPFWSLDRQAWVSAGELSLGERVQTATGETRLESRDRVTGVHPVYNLEVEGDHEYFAGVGFARVHNACEGGDVPGGASNAAAASRYRNELAAAEAIAPGSANSGTVIVRRPAAGGSEAQLREYTATVNLAEREGYLSPTGRVSTQGGLRDQASRSAGQERRRAVAAGTPYRGVVGHSPDTTWTGRPDAPFWTDLDSRVNSSLGRQAQDYPIGYRPTGFIFEDDL